MACHNGDHSFFSIARAPIMPTSIMFPIAFVGSMALLVFVALVVARMRVLSAQSKHHRLFAHQ